MAKKTGSKVSKKKGGKELLPKDLGLGMDIRKFSWEFLRHLFYTEGRTLEMATTNDLYMAVAYAARNQLREAVDQISSGSFSRGDRNLFKPIVDSLLHGDPYLLFADYRSYVESQEQVSLAYEDQAKWTQMSILNVARMGKFSSDRSIKEYCDKIWMTNPITVELGKYAIG